MTKQTKTRIYLVTAAVATQDPWVQALDHGIEVEQAGLPIQEDEK